MDRVTLTIDGVRMEVPAGTSIPEAARRANIYIPTLCFHPDLPPFEGVEGVTRVHRGAQTYEGTATTSQEVGCRLCLVEVEGMAGASRACATSVALGMVVRTETPTLVAMRRDNLARILTTHPHVCLTCPQREGCPRTICSMNVPEGERCCEKLGHCQVQKVAEYVGIRPDTPRYLPRALPMVEDEPLFRRDYNLCINCGRCVRACGDLRGIGALGVTFQSGEALVGTLRSTLADSACKFCGACMEVCPTGTLMDKAKSSSREDLVPCQSACPLEIDIPEYVRRVAQGQHPGAILTVMEKAPLPGVLGRVCFHPCETACRRGQVSEPIAICALKRFAWEESTGKVERDVPSPSDGKKVAIVGSGPAGLPPPTYLTRGGHSVTLFESLPELGGMLRYGIPEYRLPPAVLQADLDYALQGVETRTGVALGKDISLQDLRGGHDAVLLAIGAQESRRIAVPSVELEGILWGVDFLRDIRLGKAPKLAGDVVVVGGGNVAMDVALSARRLGARSVTVACLESRDEMPAHQWECENALAEGVTLHNGWGPKEVLSSGGRVAGIELKRCTTVFDAEGRFNPQFDESSTMRLGAATVILAIGQAVDLSAITPDCGVKTARGLVATEEKSCRTSLPGVFAAGDGAGQSLSVVEAMASGVKAAAEIDRFLGGTGGFLASSGSGEEPDPRLGREEGFALRLRETVPCLTLEARSHSFAEIDLGFDGRAALREASRCLQCDLRFCISAAPLPPEEWLELNADQVARVPEVEGVYQLLDEGKAVLQISGVINVRQALEGHLGHAKARYFLWEEDPMYTQRESELIQQFLQQHGRLPEGSGEDDDLFD